MILIDGGSTHNFVQECLIKSLGLNAQPTPTLTVLVGNGNEVECCQLCMGFAVHVQGRMFTVDLHVLPLCGVDIVLGVQWLKSLGPVLIDYNDLTMKFVHEGKLIELKGNLDMALQAVTPPQLHRLIQTRSASEYFHIRVCSQALPSQNTHPDIITLTTQFASLFQSPTTLPPSQTTIHPIHLLPNSTQETSQSSNRLWCRPLLNGIDFRRYWFHFAFGDDMTQIFYLLGYKRAFW